MPESNHSFNQKPVIFLAFANDRAKYLRNLRIECREIERVLEKAIMAGLCEVEVRTDAAIEDILDVFQRKTYKDRIAVFHYGGHADDYALILQTFEGDPSPAYRDGLVSFFVRQKGLKLIFLNGCSTEQHARELKKAGIPAVIGTSQDIDDEVARKLAIRFYNGIANGSSLESSWKDAEDGINILGKKSDLSALYCVHKTGHKDRFPWNIHFKEGSEKIKDWNLPDAANNPLYGLPPIPQTFKLPVKPFLLLNRYERKHAELFWGRSKYIRKLYDRVTNEKSSPIILLYGQSGVGKSSLLEAGLLPRMEESHIVLYTRRLQEKGLLGTLEQALKEQLPPGRRGQNPDFANKWKLIESKTRKPLVIILDQVEQVYTRPNKNLANEFEDFMKALKTLFDSPTGYPRGKLILSYRKEYHSEIEEQFNHNELDCTRVFLQPLERQEIIEVVTGLNRSQRMRDKYNLEVEDQLPVIIADDLLEDRESPVAPTLQIVLTKMWDISKIDDSSPVREFTVDKYLGLRKQVLHMEDFFKQQLGELERWDMDVVYSGLALDLLKFHTTSLGTACSRNIEDIQQTYSHRLDIVDELVKQLKNLYLLTDAREGKKVSSLAHDTLAPIVIKEYNDSDKPGQRAARILTAKIKNKGSKKQVTYLDKSDLLTIKQGQKGMWALIPEEKKLMKKSLWRNKVKTFLRNTAIVVIIFFAAVTVWQLGVASKERRISLANKFSSQAQSIPEDYPAEALGLAKKAYFLDKNKNVTQALSQAAAQTLEHPLCNLNLQHSYHVNSAVFSPSGHRILTASEDKTAKLWDLQGKLLQDFKHQKPVTSAVFSPGGRFILTVSRDKAAKLWDLHGNLLQDFKHEKRVTSAVFSPDGRTILTASYDNTARLWSLHGTLLNVFSHRNDVNAALFSPNGSRILTVSRDKTAWLLDLQGAPLKGFYGVNTADFSPNGKYIIFILYNNTVKLWNLEDNTERLFKNHSQFVHLAVVSPDSSSILLAYLGGAAELKDLDGQRLTSFGLHKETVYSAAFSPDGTKILTASKDRTAKLWNLNGDLVADLHLHQDHVISGAFSPDGTRIVTASKDHTAKMWDLKDQLLTDIITHKGVMKFADFSPDGTKILTVSGNNIVQLWDMRGNLTAKLNKHTKTVHTAIFSPDGTQILTASADNTAKLWDLEGSIITDFSFHTDNVNSAVFSPDGRLILTASYDDTAKLWDLQGTLLRTYKHKKDVISARFSPDGKRILTASFDETAKLWNLQGDMLKEFKKQYGQVKVAIFSPDGTKVLTLSASTRLWHVNGRHLTEFNILKYIKVKMSIEKNYFVNNAVFSPDSNRVLTVHNDNTARLWDLQGKLLIQMEHQAKIYSAEFSPDGTRIVTASGDNTIKLWDMDGNLVSDMNKHKGDVYSAVFSPNGKRILSTSADKTVKLWYTPRGIIQWMDKNFVSPFIPKENKKSNKTKKGDKDETN
jgi:WD40 repeat protein/GTPase SAR1 family protein